MFVKHNISWPYASCIKTPDLKKKKTKNTPDEWFQKYQSDWGHMMEWLELSENQEVGV